VESDNVVRIVSDYIRGKKPSKAEKKAHDLADTTLTVHQMQKQKQQLQFLNLIFMDPCIVVWFSRNNQQDATQ